MIDGSPSVTRHPAPGTRHPAPGTRHPATTTCALQLAPFLNAKVLPQHLLQLSSRTTCNANHFVARSLASHHMDRAPGHRENLGKEIHQRNIRSAIKRRSQEGELQRIAHRSGNGCSRSSRLNPHWKRRPQRMVTNGDHFGYFRAPNKAVPIRTWVAPSAIATAKS